jgi:hypothetical protein
MHDANDLDLPPDETRVSSVNTLVGFFEDLIGGDQIDCALVDLAASSGDLLTPLGTDFERLVEIQTLQELLGNQGPRLPRELKGLFQDVFRLWAHFA